MAGIGAQVLQEVKELREDVHEIDKKLAVHIVSDSEKNIRMDKLCKDYYGNGNNEGTKTAVNSHHKEAESKLKLSSEFRVKISTGIILLLLTIILNTVIAKIIP